MQRRSVYFIAAGLLLCLFGIIIMAAINHRNTYPHEQGPITHWTAGPDEHVKIELEGCNLREANRPAFPPGALNGKPELLFRLKNGSGEIKGFSLQEGNWPELRFRAFSPEPKLLFRLKKGPSGRLTFRMDNLSPEASVDGAETIDSSHGGTTKIYSVFLNTSSPCSLEWKLPSSHEDFSFYAFGDNRHQYQVLEEIREDVLRERPLFLANTGDLVNHGSEQELVEHIEFAESFGIPYYTVLGNHDLEEGTQRARPYRKIFGPTFYSFRYGPYTFFFLDNASGYISIRQVEWLRDEMYINKDAVSTFVFAHQPPFDPRKGHHHAMKPVISLAPLLDTIARRGGVDFFITGHIHSYYEHTSGGIKYIVTGNAKGGGVEPLPVSHYVKFDVTPAGVTHEIRLTGTEAVENQ